MNETLGEQTLKEFTRQKPGIAVAEGIDGLGCSVYADGEMLVWASPQVEDLVGIHLRNGATITTQTKVQYFLLGWNGMREFTVLEGPLSAEELTAAMQRHFQIA